MQFLKLPKIQFLEQHLRLIEIKAIELTLKPCYAYRRGLDALYATTEPEERIQAFNTELYTYLDPLNNYHEYVREVGPELAKWPHVLIEKMPQNVYEDIAARQGYVSPHLFENSLKRLDEVLLLYFPRAENWITEERYQLPKKKIEFEFTPPNEK